METFEALGINQPVQQAILRMGFEAPMAVQREVIPHLLADTPVDMVAQAQTGTGKTAAFGLPMVQKTDTKDNRTQYLILSPTRELCVQISNDLTQYAINIKNIKIVAVYGGASIERQIKQLRRGAHIISATPGRLLDLLNRRAVDISNIKTVVLDEADEMLNMGFRPDLEAILSRTTSVKNTLLFSATMPDEIRTVAERFMHRPLEISVGQLNTSADNISHRFYKVNDKDKYTALTRILREADQAYGIIFCRTRRETNKVAEMLGRDGFPAQALHGDLSQQQRDQVMKNFRQKKISFLVATDVAARGLDVNDLTHIINYHIPDDTERYVHRSGRTGRIGKSGVSIVLVNNREVRQMVRIEHQIRKKFSHCQIPSQTEIGKKQILDTIDRLTETIIDPKKIDSVMPAVYQKLEKLDRNTLIEKIVSLELEKINGGDIVLPEFDEVFSAAGLGTVPAEEEGFTRFFINLGKNDKLKPAKLIGMINDFTGTRDISVGQIEILDNFSFFETDGSWSEQILNSFKGKKLKNRPIILERAGLKSAPKKNRRRQTRKRKFSRQF